MPALPSGRKLPLQLSPWHQIIQVLTLYFCHLLSCCPSARAQNEWVWVSPYTGPLRDTPEIPGSFVSFSHNLHWFLQPEVLETSPPGTGTLSGTGRSDVGPGTLAPSRLRYPSQFLTATCVSGTSLSESCPSLPVSVWLFLYILRHSEWRLFVI